MFYNTLKNNLHMTVSLLTAVSRLLSGEGSSFIFEVSPAEPMPEN